MYSNATTTDFPNPFFPARQATTEPEPAPWPIPNAATMERRQAFRAKIFSDTAAHRRVHQNVVPPQQQQKQRRVLSKNNRPATLLQGTAASTAKSRNIVHVLFDRQTRGSFATTLSDTRIWDGRQERKRDRSPSTVFESPVTTVPNPGDPANDDSQNDERGLYDNSSAPPTHHHQSSSSEETPCTTAMEEQEEEEETFSVAEYGTLPQRVVWPLRISKEIRHFMEYLSAVSYHSAFLNHLGGDDALDELGNRPPSSRAVSTISVAFSPNGQTMASTHGDHTVKISCCTTGRLLQSLEGHPRTPWTVKYHPIDAHMVASGCLGHQVRVWNWMEKTCLQMVRLEFAIISLSFHPSGRLLAVANGTRLHFWGIDHGTTRDIPINRPSALASVQNRSALLTEMDQRHMLRCVHFPPDGKSLIIGGVNPTNEDPRRRTRGGIGGGGGISFYLRLWDFDADVALQPPMETTSQGITVPRRAISNPRTFLPRALLYNDGGFDVSPDGKSLCACAEYWLPEGINNAMELVHQEEIRYENEQRREEREAERRVSSGLTSDGSSLPRTTSGAISRGLSPAFRDTSEGISSVPPRTPTTSQHATDFVPRTPEPVGHFQPMGLSPPPPPGRRLVAGATTGSHPVPNQAGAPPAQSPAVNVANRGLSTPPPPPPPPPPPAPGPVVRPPHPLSTVTSSNYPESYLAKGRYVPHVVTISLDTTYMPADLAHLMPRGKPYAAVAKGYQPRMGQLLEACPLDASKASAVTCVKFSPSTDFCLIGYGVREPVMENGNNNNNNPNGNANNGGPFHPVTAVYRVRGGMSQVSTMLSGDDDVNIARFHPDSGYGFVYGTKQGRVRVLSRRPWMFYTTPDDDESQQQ